MDSKLPIVKEWQIKQADFAPITSPDYRELNVNPKMPQQVPMLPTEDTRYPWYAAQMSDSRYATDYRNRCSANIPVGSQNKTREWMMNNATNIIDVSRRRMAERSGYADIYKVPRMPEQGRVMCDAYQCERTVNQYNGWTMGDIRPNSVPELFGTYLIEPSIYQQMGKKKIGGTTTYEGGRNAPSRMRVLSPQN